MSDARTTIRDLQNARQVLAHVGHAKGGYITLGEGSVCLEGAIRLATTSKMATQLVLPGISVWQIQPDEMYVMSYERRCAAIDALGAVLPETCPADHPEGTTEWDATDPSSRIWHFNDHVCGGGDEADLVLEQAIQKLEANL